MAHASDSFSGLEAKTTLRPRALKFDRETVALIAILAILSWHHFAAHAWTLPLLLLGALPVAVASGNRAVIHLGTLASLTYLVPFLFPAYPSLLIARAATLAAYLAVLLCIPTLRQSVLWWRVGTLDRRALRGVGIFMGVFGLFTWWYVARFQPGHSSRLLPQTGSVGLWLVYLLGAAAVNALFEEIFWRGVMYDAAVSVWGVAALALAIQAAQFGVAHFRGPFYSAWVGVGVTALFGVLQGYFRHRTGGLLLPWLVHVVCDIVVLTCTTHGGRG